MKLDHLQCIQTPRVAALALVYSAFQGVNMSEESLQQHGGCQIGGLPRIQCMSCKFRFFPGVVVLKRSICFLIFDFYCSFYCGV